MSTTTTNFWISVVDGLPDHEDDVIAWGSDGGMYTDAAYIRGQWFTTEDVVADVTHWQPLPKPPEPA